MSHCTRAGKVNIAIREKALSLVKDLPPKHKAAEVEAVFLFVRDKIRYIHDINGVETVYYPDELLKIGQGDCDDKSVLLASLLESIGFSTRFVAIALQGRGYCHVLTEVLLYDKWLPLETTLNVNAGWFPPDATREIIEDN